MRHLRNITYSYQSNLITDICSLLNLGIVPIAVNHLQCFQTGAVP